MTSQEFENLIEFLERTPEGIRQLVDDLVVSDLGWKPSGGEFSALENVCHLRDIECEGYQARIEKLLNETEPYLPDIDGTRLAEERDYNQQDFAQALAAFASARQDNVRVLKNIPPAALKLRGTFENTGMISLAELLVMMREHDQSHLQELNDLRNRLLERER